MAAKFPEKPWPEPPLPQKTWPRAIILVDMDAFFASIEQLDFPELRGKPVGVTNGLAGTCIITPSYEARAFGIKTGMQVKEAKSLCPGFIQRPSRPLRYAELSTRIMTALQDVTPDVEVFSVDEAFLDVTRCQRLHGSPERIAEMTREKVRLVSGLSCSVGLSGDKTTAKYAARLRKPDGLFVIPPWEAEARLHDVPVTELCGIKDGIGNFLASRGVRTCGQMKHLPPGELERRFGGLGLRIWLMCQGQDPSAVSTASPPPKSIGHGKVMPPNTRDVRVLRTYLQHMAEKVAARLRKHGLEAQSFFIGLLARNGYLGGEYRCTEFTSDGRQIMQLCDAMLRDHWCKGEHNNEGRQGVHQVQITATDPRPAQQQLGLFSQNNKEDRQRQALLATLDLINARYGEFTAAPATLMERSDTPNVISPAWKPSGHRQTI